MATASNPYEMRFSTEDSIGVLLFRTELEKVARPGVRIPADDGMIAERAVILGESFRRLIGRKKPQHVYWIREW